MMACKSLILYLSAIIDKVSPSATVCVLEHPDGSGLGWELFVPEISECFKPWKVFGGHQVGYMHHFLILGASPFP